MCVSDPVNKNRNKFLQKLSLCINLQFFQTWKIHLVKTGVCIYLIFVKGNRKIEVFGNQFLPKCFRSCLNKNVKKLFFVVLKNLPNNCQSISE